MMIEYPVVSVWEMREADARTIAAGTPGIELMYRAAKGVYDVYQERRVVGWYGKRIVIVCGPGNNGGDGYALATILHEEGHKVALVLTSNKFSEDGAHYYDMCVDKSIPIIMMEPEDKSETKDKGRKNSGNRSIDIRNSDNTFHNGNDVIDNTEAENEDINEYTDGIVDSQNNASDALKTEDIIMQDEGDDHKKSNDGEELKKAKSELERKKRNSKLESLLLSSDIIVDCMLGTGFAGMPRGNIRDMIDIMDKVRREAEPMSRPDVISVDINSGMNGDTGMFEAAVTSDLTVSIGFYKTGFFTGNAKEIMGDLVNVDIGIDIDAGSVSNNEARS